MLRVEQCKFDEGSVVGLYCICCRIYWVINVYVFLYFMLVICGKVERGIEGGNLFLFVDF